MTTQVMDPVCGMIIDADKTEYKSKYQGKTYSFCSADCKKAFEAEPKKFAEAHEYGHQH